MAQALIVVDSSVWIDFFAKRDTVQVGWLRAKLPLQIIAVPDLVLFEVARGVTTDKQFKEVTFLLGNLELLTTAGHDLAVNAAQNYRTLRTAGCTIRSGVDCILATLCLQGGHSLLHRDRDYDSFEQHLGLKVIHPD